MHLLYKDDNGKWVTLPDVTIMQSKNKDVATFEMETFMSKFCIMRAKEVLAEEHVGRVLTLLEASLTKRMTQIVLRQNIEDAKDVVLQCVPMSRSERYQRKLSEEGYDLGPSPSHELILHEGQKMFITFRGNIQEEQQGIPCKLKFVFNTHIKNRVEFSVEEIDQFAQKSIDCYRGFAQVFTRGLVDKQVPVDPDNPDKKKNVPMKTIVVEDDILLCEMLINLPKASCI